MDRARRDRGHAGRARRTARRTLAVLTFEARMNTSSQKDSVQDIRGVLIQVGGARLLLPNATNSEVLSYADPEPVENAPEWLLCRIRWRGWQLPLVSFSRDRKSTRMNSSHSCASRIPSSHWKNK